MSRKSKALEFANETYTFNVEGRHVSVTDYMKSYAIEKLSKIERFSDPSRIIDVHVIMDIQKMDHRVEVILKVNDHLITAHTSSDEMYKSIDKAVDIVTEQLRRYKERMQDHKGPSIAEVDMNVNILSIEEDDLEELNEAIDQKNEEELINKYQLKVVSREKYPVKTLTQQEAVRSLFITGAPFLLFRSEDDRRLRLIYRREDGSFALIEPDGL